ncbi:helix-turn-helix domain-containing protein [Streptomyces tubbatahanensis]|uniref:Helix-turn-helix domain-containing protein n=1 Tax=Streptomyces tubbatahanensis TaxID=2923272 RepID=A0ABY3XZX0_9ACTN|nr:helix-turn-helix transcriptional regulator [Streptomyces tubbatahanensis]UNT00096.1 helix-turn-helix domain-containing protein [Streptomyces tubbatahanensis]
MVRLPLTPAEVARGERLGALLRRARGGRSMLDVALASGISPETLRKIESGRVATPAFPTIAAIADSLGLSLDAVWAEISQISQAERTTEEQPAPPVTRHPSLAS